MENKNLETKQENSEVVQKSENEFIFYKADIQEILKAKESVLKKSEILAFKEIVKGYDFNQGVDYSKIFESYKLMGFQATGLGRSIDIVNKMISWKLSDEPVDDDENISDEEREKTRCTIFLGYTSNMVSCGMREIIRYLCEHKMIDVIVTTAGGIEEDFIKCLAPTFMGDFHLRGSELR